MALVLLGTEACHLCEDAQSLLLPLADRLATPVYVDDIAQSIDLVERYGVRIPVLCNEDTQAELDWPFSLSELIDWLHAQGCLRA